MEYEPPPPPPYHRAGPTGTPPSDGDLPWEAPGRPLVRALWDTVLLFLREPDLAFARMRRDAAYLRPLAYAVLLCWFAALVNGLYSFAFNATVGRLLSGFSGSHEIGNEAMLQTSSMVLSPLITVVWLFLLAGIAHLLIMMLGGVNAGFAATLRVLCYAQSPLPLSIIPLVGPPIAGIWALVLGTKGLATVHEMSIGKALLVILLPGLVCCACGAWMFAGLLGAAFLGGGM